MSDELDIESLKEYKGSGAPFMEFKEPEGDDFVAYTFVALEDLRKSFSERFNKDELHAQVRIEKILPEGAAVPRMKSKPSEFVEVGKTYTVNFSRHSPLEKKIQRFSPLKGKKFQAMNRGKAKYKGKPYTDYVVVQLSEEMTAEQLLFIGMPEV